MSAAAACKKRKRTAKEISEEEADRDILTPARNKPTVLKGGDYEIPRKVPIDLWCLVAAYCGFDACMQLRYVCKSLYMMFTKESTFKTADIEVEVNAANRQHTEEQFAFATRLKFTLNNDSTGGFLHVCNFHNLRRLSITDSSGINSFNLPRRLMCAVLLNGMFRIQNQLLELSILSSSNALINVFTSSNWKLPSLRVLRTGCTLAPSNTEKLLDALNEEPKADMPFVNKTLETLVISNKTTTADDTDRWNETLPKFTNLKRLHLHDFNKEYSNGYHASSTDEITYNKEIIQRLETLVITQVECPMQLIHSKNRTMKTFIDFASLSCVKTVIVECKCEHVFVDLARLPSKRPDGAVLERIILLQKTPIRSCQTANNRNKKKTWNINPYCKVILVPDTIQMQWYDIINDFESRLQNVQSVQF